MKTGIVIPNPVCSDLTGVACAAQAGAKGLVAKPEVFVDESFGLRIGPEDIAAGLTGAGLELAAIEAARPLLDASGDTAAGVEHVKKCLDLADALRDYAPEGALPVVVCEAGPGGRDNWPGLTEALKELGAAAEGRQALIALKPDRNSAVDRSRNALKILTDVAAPYVQVALDAAATIGDKDTLDKAVDRLKENIVLAFARDVAFDEEGKPSYPAPGSGMLNYQQYVDLLGTVPGCTYLVVGHLASADEVKAAVGLVGGLVQ
jgi:sugar phosphate isomerase/epimerase